MTKKIWIVLAVYLAALLAGLALYDEKPDPDMLKEMNRPLPAVLAPGNAWIAMLGITAPEGVSPFAWGEKRFRKVLDAVSSGKGEEDLSSISDADDRSLSFKGEITSIFGEPDQGLLTQAASHAGEIAVLLRDNEELLRRYESFAGYPHYTEPLDWGVSVPFPSFSQIRNAQRLKLLRIAVKAGRDNVTPALEQVREDAEFWRRISRSSTTLISKLISISLLNADLRFAAELGANRTLKQREREILLDILRPFDRGETDMTGALRGEARIFLKGIDLSVLSKGKRLSDEGYFIKPNATRNRMYEYYRDLYRLAALSPGRFAEEFGKPENNEEGLSGFNIRYLYNPSGEILASIGKPNVKGYIERGHNMEGLRRLALLKVTAHREKIRPDGMRSFLESHAAALGNPYTGRAMTWNPKAGSISFKCLSDEKPVEIFLQ